MPLLKLRAKGVGPFKDQVDIDFSKSKGRPHLGPHILAGVNGSGKSTVLRAIASHLAFLKGDGTGFPLEQWKHLRHANAEIDCELTRDWMDYCVATYAPSRSLRFIQTPNYQVHPNAALVSLGFESSIDNEITQARLISLYSRHAITKMKGGADSSAELRLSEIGAALSAIFGTTAALDVRTTGELTPVVTFQGKELNFSQLPDGARYILGIIVDFTMRYDKDRDALLMIDEVDAHLHPRWQRQILPALRAAFPHVQIIVTTHSPFVISSCPEARVHILDVDDSGDARLKASLDAPFGESLLSVMNDIFGVESRFDIQTERDLKEWNDLKRSEAAGSIKAPDRARLIELTQQLGERSEELFHLVGPAPKPPAKQAGVKPARKTKRR